MTIPFLGGMKHLTQSLDPVWSNLMFTQCACFGKDLCCDLEKAGSHLRRTSHPVTRARCNTRPTEEGWETPA